MEAAIVVAIIALVGLIAFLIIRSKPNPNQSERTKTTTTISPSTLRQDRLVIASDRARNAEENAVYEETLRDLEEDERYYRSLAMEIRKDRQEKRKKPTNKPKDSTT